MHISNSLHLKQYIYSIPEEELRSFLPHDDVQKVEKKELHKLVKFIYKTTLQDILIPISHDLRSIIVRKDRMDLTDWSEQKLKKAIHEIIFTNNLFKKLKVKHKDYSTEEEPATDEPTSDEEDDIIVTRIKKELPQQVIQDPSKENITTYKKEIIDFLSQINEKMLSVEINNPIFYPELLYPELPKPSPSDLKRFQLRDNPDFSNFTVTLKTGNSFTLDKIFLASTSQYFEKFFTSDFKEKNEKIATCQLDFEIEPKLFEKYIEFAYTKSIENIDTIEEIVSLGHFSQAIVSDDLKLFCSHKLRLLLTKETFLTIANYAYETNDELLIDRCKLFFSTHPTWIEKNAPKLPELDVPQLIQLIRIAQFDKTKELEKLICKEIETKISYVNFEFICSTAIEIPILKKICSDFVELHDDFSEKIAPDTLLMYNRLLQ